MPDVYGNCKFFLYWNLSEISPLPLHVVYFSTKKINTYMQNPTHNK